VSDATTGVAALRMYDLAEARAPLAELWSAIASRLDSAPDALTWTGDLRAQSLDPGLVLGQTCGWPLVRHLRERVVVVGAFHHDIEDQTAPATYRSVLIAAEPGPIESFAGTVGAVSEWDSLSGYVSLGVAVADAGGQGRFFGRVIETGSHLASIDAVRSGAAALASIDAVTFALLARHRPTTTDGLVAVGRGPRVPTLPLITARRDPEPVRAAIEDALADPMTDRCRSQLLVRGFVRLDLSGYEPLARLGPIAESTLGSAPTAEA
jgi:ABC-type phosphate/phosphonate transport system substrate-binding protein